MLLFLHLFVAAVEPPPVGGLPVDLFLRIDPLFGLTTALAAREVTAYLWWALPMVLLALVAGRLFCGWLCPLGTTLDLASPRRRAAGRKAEPPQRWRTAKYLLLAALLGGALVGGTALSALDPISLLTRTLATVLYPVFALGFTATQTALFHAGVLPDLWVWLDINLRGNLLPIGQPYFRQTTLFLGVFAAIVAANWLAPRFWCRYLCPLGAMLGLFGRWAPMRRRLNTACDGCGVCATTCPMGTGAGKGEASDPAECLLCLRCRDVCPRGAVEVGPARAAVSFSPSRRQALWGLAGGVAVLGSLRVSGSAAWQDPWLVRPPGAVDDFLARCVRCGKCMKVCPTAGLQPAWLESGLEGIWSPVLVSRLGFCDYSCAACGQVCPTGAIAPLDVATKREQVIGVAYLDERRCLPYADGVPCIVCEEMCPVPEKAIVLKRGTVDGPEGEPVEVDLPRVIRERCIGCGICEYYCPLPNEAAIRVYATGPLAEREYR